MKAEWDRPADAAVVGEAAAVLLSAGGRSGVAEGGLESVGAPGRNEKLSIDRLGEALAKAEPAVPPGEQADLKNKVLESARTGLAKLNQGEGAERFTFGESVGLEAVILTDGERPSLFVTDGFVSLDAPDIGTWAADLGRVKNQIRTVTAAVGRVDVPVKPWYAGTCFVAAEGLVVTNRHVLEVIGTQQADGSWILRWPDKTTVNFLGEDGAKEQTQFKVTGVAFSGPNPINNTINFANLDMAVLRVDPASDNGAKFPQPLSFERDVSKPETDRDLYVVGFPGEPKTWVFGGKPPVGHETQQVISSLFNSKFGVKRLAPGIVKAGPGSVPTDDRKWIAAHDASTLGGNSGSCVVDLKLDGLRVVALHFAGANRAQNWSHAVGCLHEHLSQFPVKFA